MRFILFLPALFLLSACANLSDLRKANPSGDTFSSALAAEYLGYAESEDEQGRSSNASYYAGKGLKAFKGENVQPDELNKSLPAKTQEEMQLARKDLMTLLTEDVKRVSPQKLARLQILFDCWQQQAERAGAKPETSCADEFKPADIELQNVSELLLYSEVKNYPVNFRYNSDHIMSISNKELNSIVRELSAQKDFLIVIQTGTPRGRSQQALQNRRQKMVYNLLVRAGIPEKRIREYSEGDSKRVVLSEDKPESVNGKSITVIVKTPKAKKG